jgi:lysophospholipase L1-like esterase
MKLLIRGSSISAGFGVERSYPEIIASLSKGKKIELINRSRPFETSFDAIGTFYKDICPFQPQVLLLHFGTDDAFLGVYRSEFQENLVQLIRLSRKHCSSTVFLATSHTFDDPHDMEAVNIYYRAMRVVAQDLGCYLIPVHIYWAGYLHERGLRNNDLTCPGGLYPNSEGHRVMADCISRWILGILT